MSNGFNQKQLGANYRWDYDNLELIEQIEKVINSILEKIKNINNIINTIQTKITNVENKFDNEINVLYQQLGDNIDFLQKQINTINSRLGTLETNLSTEIQNRINGDNAIHNRLNSIQFLKWLDRIEFGADLSQPQLVLGDNDFTVYYSFPEKYKYTNIWVLDVELNQNSQTIFHNIAEFGVSWNLVGTDGDGNKGTFFQVSYKHENNQHRGSAEPIKYYIYMLYTQYRTDVNPDVMPY